MSHVDIETSEMMTVTEASKLLGKSRRTTYRLAEAGKIPSTVVAGRILVPADALKQQINEAKAS